MVHGDTITDKHSIGLEGYTTSLPHPSLDRLGDASEMDVSGYHLAEAIYYTYKRLGEVIIAQTQRSEQSAVGCPFRSLFNYIASHCTTLILAKNSVSTRRRRMHLR